MKQTFDNAVAYALTTLHLISSFIGFAFLYLILFINPMYMSGSSNAPEYPNLVYEIQRHIDRHESGETVKIQDVLKTVMYVNTTVWNSIFYPEGQQD